MRRRRGQQGETEPKPGTDPDYTVGTKRSHFSDGLYYVEDVIRGRWSPGVVDQTIRQTAELDGPRVRIREEQEGGHSGKNVIASHTRMLAGYDYQGQPATGAKTTRWRPFAVQAEAAGCGASCSADRRTPPTISRATGPESREAERARTIWRPIGLGSTVLSPQESHPGMDPTISHSVPRYLASNSQPQRRDLVEPG